MIIIADSGSTKTRWALGAGHEDERVWRCVETSGLNPRMTSDEAFAEALTAVAAGIEGWEHKVEEVSEVRFYGAGCGSAEMQARVRGLLAKEFANAAEIEVEGDLLGACRAVSEGKAGVVGILGTGSNACVFDGERIVRQVPSAGYILGDEGSGNHIGRRLLKDFITDRMPAEIAAELKTSKEEVMRRIYSGEYPNRYMASFAPTALKHRETEYVRVLLNEVFGAFWREMVSPIAEGGEVRLVGSVAAAFEREIRAAAPEGFTIGRVVKDPIEGMVDMLIC
ncbi:MAG: hypothetical protein J5526_07150 [Bacteroidales bacterium]|nr:hypothetical protein [Bacteroidales bacterium]